MEFLKTFDSDDDVEFVETFFNVVQHIHDEESSNAARTRAVVNRDRQAAHDLLLFLAVPVAVSYLHILPSLLQGTRLALRSSTFVKHIHHVVGQTAL
ncbi:unnamed protein product [Lactuca virosa]|uniref:Uncharacterized protein n=1 Tax=Lactuca virosa TaxID=75947 RepID=A0AAU9NLV3_9ASTR|nr:unnamed protein product [Lactuca virosa]